MIEPYYADGQVSLYLGDCRDVLPALGETFDACLADPPYQETSLAWDRWPDGWITAVAHVTTALWCFGSLSMFGERWSEFKAAGWKVSHDVVWEKHNGSGFAVDRFKRVHELVQLWYRGRWDEQRHEVPRIAGDEERVGDSARRRAQPPHTGSIGPARERYEYDGTRLARSVIRVPSAHGRAIHPTEKPIGILRPLIEFSCAGGGARCLIPSPGAPARSRPHV